MVGAALQAEARKKSVREPAHIALVIANLGGGGAQRKMVTLANAFVARGHRVDLVLAESGGVLHDRVDPRVEVRCLENVLTRLPFIADAKRRRMLAATWPLSRYLREARPRVVISSSDSVNVATVLAHRLARSSARLVLRIDNQLTRSGEVSGTWSQRRRMRRVRNLFPRADRLIAISHGLGEDVLRQGGCRPAQLHVIHNPAVDASLAQRALEPTAHRWLREPGPPVVLAVGRLVPQKDLPTLLRAFARMRQKTEARLLVLGDGREHERLRALASELGVATDVDLPGFDPNPIAAMARASVFVLSSAWEGFGNVLVEALAVGCPVVSTDCPSGPDEILDGGRYGRLVPVGDPAALADAILATLREPGDPELRRRRAQEFSVDVVAERYLAVLLD
jgi:glycosyltransferase involved in cell wall biosynthesis